jgi:hypothetical protein
VRARPPQTTFAIASVCLLNYAIAVWSGIYLGVPPKVYNPTVTKIFGNFVYLTYCANFVGACYFSAHWLAAVSGNDALDAALVRLFPVTFTLGCFMSVAYYGLDYFNEDNRRRKAAQKKHYPYCEVSSHLEHGLPLPTVLGFALSLRVDPASDAGSVAAQLRQQSFDLPIFICMCGYVAMLHYNKSATGLWAYGLFDDVTRSAGVAGRCALVAALMLAALALSRFGIWLVP